MTDRFILCGALTLFAMITVYGMRIGNAEISSFGQHEFELFAGAMLLLLNKELFSQLNGKGNGNGATPTLDLHAESGPADPTKPH